MTPALQELIAIPQWVAHTADKVPIGPDGRAASSTDPNTWMRCEDAKRVCREHGLAGVGFVMSKDDTLVGVDLDNAIREDGSVKAWAYEIVRELSSYTEVSPSGRGLHVWVRGKLPRGGSRIKVEDGWLEVYESARYFTVTGDHVPGTAGTIYDWGSLSTWYWHRFPSVPPPAPAGPRAYEGGDEWIEGALAHIPADDYDVWTQVGMGLKDELGDSGFDLWRTWSASSSKYDGDERAWRKWQSFRGTGFTIATVRLFATQNGWTPDRPSADDILPGTEAFWDRYRLTPDEGTGSGPGPVTDDVADRLLFTAGELFHLENQRQYLLEPKVAGAGDKLIMAGPPKSMKSFMLIDMLSHFAEGEQWHGIMPARPLRSLMFNLEIHHEAMGDRLKVLAKNGGDNLVITRRLVGKPPLEVLQRIVDYAEESGGFDVVVIDPLANWFTGDSENDNAEMIKHLGYLDQLRGIIGEDAILWLIHHTRKVSKKEMEANPFAAFRGASSIRGWYDTGMSVWRDHESKEIALNFEMRNGEGLDPRTLAFDRGVFVEVEADDTPAYSWLMRLEAFMHEVGGHRSVNEWSEKAAQKWPEDVTSRAWRKRLANLSKNDKASLEGYVKW